MTILGGFIFPHGAITLDPDIRDLSKEPAYLPTTKENCLKLHAAMKSQAETLVSLKPDLIIVITPHGLSLQDNFLLLGNQKASGDAQWDGEWTEFKAEVTVESTITKNLLEVLKPSGNLVELLTLGAATDPLPLRWAEVIPLWFIKKAAEKASVTKAKPNPRSTWAKMLSCVKSAGKALRAVWPRLLCLPEPNIVPGQTVTITPTVIMGIPKRRLMGNKKMIPELLKLGTDIWSFINDTLKDKRVAIVISCDLAHSHSKDPTSPYPFNEFAVSFDNFCVDWAKINIDKSQVSESSQSNTTLLTRAGNISDPVLTCGYPGLVLLQGILIACAEKNGTTFKANFLEYSWPTYFGMMVAHFVQV